jgi:hypothetical protein
MAMYLALDGCIHQAENVVVDTPTELVLDLKNQQDSTFPQEYLSLKCQRELATDCDHRNEQKQTNNERRKNK